MVQASGVRVTVLVENWIDILLPPSEGVRRTGLIHHFDRKETPLQAENGFSLLIETFRDGLSSTILFDAGLSPDVICHNLAALHIDPRRIDHIVLSHGHFDHHGGLAGVLPLIRHPVALALHPDAVHPRYAVMGSGEISPFYNQALDQKQLEALGARFVFARDAMPITMGVITTGEIERTTSFEGPPPSPPPPWFGPGIFQVKEGKLLVDEVWDEVGLVVNVENEGLVVITGCGHAGVVNTILQAQRLTGIDKLALVMGGFHLGFPGMPDEARIQTVAALGELDIDRVAPMHCSGFKTMADVSAQMPERFLQYAVGTTVQIGRA